MLIEVISRGIKDVRIKSYQLVWNYEVDEKAKYSLTEKDIAK